jgi:hypothetical protein
MKRSTIVAALAAAFVLPLSFAPAAAAEIKLAVKIAAPEGKDVPVCVKIDLPADLASSAAKDITVSVKPAAGGPAVPGQIVMNGKQAELWWVLPQAAAGTAEWTAALTAGAYKGKDAFAFEDTPGKQLDLKFDGRLVTRYMYAFDRSTKAATFETYKPFTHVFDAEGKHVITKGAPGHDPHHRGIFIGWCDVKVGAAKYDFWSMGGGSAQVHRKFLGLTAGPVLARSTALIEWVDKDDKPIITEERQTTCFRQPASAVMLMDFRSKLTATAGDLTLDGNVEHAGFHYRAHNDVAVACGAVGGSQTADKAPDEQKTQYEFNADGIKAGQKLNNNKDLPWATLCYFLRGKRYTVQHMNDKSNPTGTVYSAYRPYGRFGAFFKKDMKAGESLPLSYRLYVAEAPMPPREEMNLRYAAFTNPPEASVVK